MLNTEYTRSSRCVSTLALATSSADLDQEAARYMRHARRTVLTTADIDLALRTLNIEPLYGHTPHAPSTFRRALPFPHLASAGAVYFVEDEEIDFDKVLREEKITVPRGVNWTAHWLAVEGVQPLVPENPPAIPREEPTPAGAEAKALQPGAAAPTQGRQLPQTTQQIQQNQLVKHVLSKELQLYYDRLTSSLLPPSSSASDTAKRTAALASLRADAGLQALLPYLVRWVGEGVVNALRDGTEGESEGKTLEILLDVVSAILENTTLFIEPYVRTFVFPSSQCLYADWPPIATPNSACHPVYAPTLQSTANQRDPPPHGCCPNACPIIDATLDDISLTFTAHHENPLGRAVGWGWYRPDTSFHLSDRKRLRITRNRASNVKYRTERYSKTTRHSGRRDSWSRRNRQGSSPERRPRRRWCSRRGR